ncbi:tRNA (guanine10-N2)-methyltransferase [Nematocida ausubeli]|nr:tRNA (guanine10-N2)-methyltransferase [Nematocida ausubeli]
MKEENKQTFILLHVDRYNSFIQPELKSLLDSAQGRYLIHKTSIEREIKYSIVTACPSTIEHVLQKSMLISEAITMLNYDLLEKRNNDTNESTNMNIIEKLNRSLNADVIANINSKIEGNYKIDCICSSKPQAIEYLIKKICVNYRVDLSNPASTISIIEDDEYCMVGMLYKKSNRKELLKYSVKNRKFIGNTSMDNEISFIICNMAGVSEKTILWDCFAGSGSILLSGALCGAMVAGTDINDKQFKGREVAHTNSRIKTQLPNTNIYSNFDMYNIIDKVLMIGVHDIFNECLFKENTVDVILCDPPYGERETIKKKTTEANEYVEGNDKYLIPSVPFFGRVIEIGRSVLKNKGRIGVFMPHTTGTTPKLREIEGFTQVAQAEQYLNSLYSRTFFLLEVNK